MQVRMCFIWNSIRCANHAPDLSLLHLHTSQAQHALSISTVAALKTNSISTNFCLAVFDVSSTQLNHQTEEAGVRTATAMNSALTMPASNIGFLWSPTQMVNGVLKLNYARASIVAANLS